MELVHENLEFYPPLLLSPSNPPFSALERFLSGQTHLLQLQSQPYTINNQMECSIGDPSSWLLPNLQGDYQDYTTSSNYDHSFHEMMSQVGPGNGATKTSMRGRKGACSSSFVKRKWSDEEDRRLVKLVKDNGMKKWACISEKLDGRSAKQCRERWQNHLRPDIKKEPWSEEEERVFIEAHKKLGNRWSEIAKRIPGRTENAVKNHWNAAKRRRAISNKKKTKEYLPKPSSFLQDYIISHNLYSPNNQNIDATKTTTTTMAVATTISELTPPPLEAEYECSSSLINEPASGEEIVFMLNLFSGSNHQPLGLLPPQLNYDNCFSYLQGGAEGHEDLKIVNGESDDQEKKEMDLIEMVSSSHYY